MDEDIPVPPWVLGEMPEPEGIGSLVYLDNAGDITTIADTLRSWYELAAALVPLFAPAHVARPRPGLRGWDRTPDGRERRVRVRRWADGLTGDLYQRTAAWVWSGPRPGEEYSLMAYAFRFRGRAHLQLMVSVMVARGLRDGLLPAVLELTRRIADVGDAAYGEVNLRDHPPAPDTNLDVALLRSTLRSADESRRYLRGYGWVTVVPRELTHRLGGAGALRASGAFADVTPFASGGVMLRATDRPGDYDAARAGRVSEALRTVLPPGRPSHLGDREARRP